MPRPTTKNEILTSAQNSYAQLGKLINNLSELELNTTFDFAADANKKEVHWSRDKNLRDILIHLYEWHQLLLRWVDANTAGKKSSFLPAPYNWRTYGQMNIEFWKKHQTTELEHAKLILEESHKAVMHMISRFSNEELFTKKYFDWTGITFLGSYCISATTSHYEWAIKKIRAHKMILK